MGKRNRKRVRSGHGQQRPARTESRAQGEARVGTPDGRGGHQGGGGPRYTDADHDPFAAALGLFDANRGWQARAEVDELAHRWTDGPGHDGLAGADYLDGIVPKLVCASLAARIGDTWRRGWQPADIPRIVARNQTAKHAKLAVTAIALEAESYRHTPRTLPLWMDQLDQIGATHSGDRSAEALGSWCSDVGLDHASALVTAFELMALLGRLPTLPQLCPPPSEWGRASALDAALSSRRHQRPVETRYLERVRALLAKAESTGFDEEAEAFTAKAQELMTRHSIDAALLASHAEGTQAGEQPTGVRIGVDDPYAQAKGYLLTVVGEASRCRTVLSPHFGFATIFGFEADLGSVELLYTSLLLQARRAMEDIGRTGKRARSRSFRQSFLVGFATRIGDRLRESAEATVADADHEQGGGLLPVLAERWRQVEELSDETFGGLRGSRISAHDSAGFLSGTTAADLAELSRGPHITAGRPGAADQVGLLPTALPPDRAATSGRVR